MSREYDVAVIGAGLAGLTAAIFTSRHGLKTAVIDPMGAGGQIINDVSIEDFPGFPKGIAGYELGPLAAEQAQAAGAEFVFDQVSALAPGGQRHALTCGADALSARAVIVACGSHLRALGVPGEQAFEGHGLSHCASCDGPFFNGETVCVVGGGDSALGEAMVLTQYASNILLFHRGERFRGQQVLQQRVLTAPKIEVRWNTEIEAILGEGQVTGVRVRNTRTGERAEHPLSGVFAHIGLEPNTQFLAGVVPLDGSGHIPTNIWMETQIPGIYAAGDIRQHSAGQLVTAAGDGATAAIAAHRYISGSG